jgi:hypothetical protein
LKSTNWSGKSAVFSTDFIFSALIFVSVWARSFSLFGITTFFVFSDLLSEFQKPTNGTAKSPVFPSNFVFGAFELVSISVLNTEFLFLNKDPFFEY